MAHNSIVCAPVEDRDRMILESNEQTIVKLMDPDRISKLLVDKGVIDHNDRKQVMVPQALGERNKMLLGKLLTRGPDAFKNYVNVLTESRTKNHTKLVKILQNDDPIPSVLSVEEKLADSRHKRISEKIDNHERRLMYLEEGVYEGRSEDDVESIRAELSRRHTELDELRQKLRTRDGELQEAREENKALQKRIVSMEKKIVTLENYIKEQKTKVETLSKQQQQDKRSIKALEDKNSKLETKMETAEKKMEKKLQDQEKRHHRDLEEIKHLLRNSAKHTSEGQSDGTNTTKTLTSPAKKAASSLRTRASSCSRVPASSNTRSSTTDSAHNKPANTQGTPANAQSKKHINLTPRNRFQSDLPPPQSKFFRAPRSVQTWKKSSADPEKKTEGAKDKKNEA